MRWLRAGLITAIALALAGGLAYTLFPERTRSLAEQAAAALPDSLVEAGKRAGVPADAMPGEQIYRWRDEDGELVYGDSPPPGVDAEPVENADPTVVPAPQEDDTQ